jgi:hypothetical protein
MKKLSDHFFIVERKERITIKIESIKTPSLVNISLDGNGFSLKGDEFEFQASAEKSTTHVLVLLFTFVEADGSYRVSLKGDAGGGSSKFTVSGSGGGVESRLLEFSVGSAEDTRVGIDPPSPWPEG